MHEYSQLAITVGAIFAGILAQRAGVKDLRSEMMAGFDLMNGAFDDLGSRFDRFEAKLDQMQAEMSAALQVLGCHRKVIEKPE